MTTTTTTSSSISFREKLESRVAAIDSLLCVGLDPHLGELFPDGSGPEQTEQVRCDAAFTFCKTLIDATAPYAACYKPNGAFFEALGVEGGMVVLQKLVRTVIPSDIPVLLDVKRGDIGSTAAAYATACYDHVGADAVTLSPFMGWDSIQPFCSKDYAKKGAFLLCKTSNPGSQEIMACSLTGADESTTTVYERIANLVGTTWSLQAPDALLGLVVGATDPEALQQARKAAGPNVWILAPGVGAQGGNLLEACRAGLNDKGTNMLIPVSRGLSKAENPAQAAQELVQQIQTAVQQVKSGAATTTTTSESIQEYQKKFIEFSLSQGVLKFGSFVLKSGRTSPYFFNAGLFASGAALFHLGNAYASAIMAAPELRDGAGVKFDVIFGPAYKGISLGAVVSSALYSKYGVNAEFAYNRKEAKDHGEGGKLVGASMEGKRILVVDDVITAGTAIRESYTMLESVQAKPVGVVIALDRAEKKALEDPVSAVQAVSRDLGLPVVSIVNLPQLQVFLEKSSDFSDEILDQVKAYRSQYGV
mmetsp:Transcript_6253/g.13033  ORF Transcript_6253/g.13033 Transcript_6253/m.13033 type:complete len:533 (-) Transcript_6253:134-1732(-)